VQDDPCFIIVGASHARNLAEQLEAAGHEATVVSTRSWRPNSQTVS
jgi:transposase